MKKITLHLYLVLCFNCAFSQEVQPDSNEATTKKSFLERFELGQSMETVDKSEQPAQLQFTFSEEKPDSYLINLGLTYKFKQKGDYIHRIKSEYHRNSLTDKEQNNFEFGYQGFWDFLKIDSTDFFVTFDLKYVYDGISIKNSIASNILFSWFNTGDNFHFNTNNYIKDKEDKNLFNFYPSVYFGTQLQHSFKSVTTAYEGFILRPMFTASFKFSLLGKEENEIVRYSFSYTGREDAANNTEIEEGYTKFMKTGLDVFLFKKNNDDKLFDVSLGLAFNKGSDPLKGLADQEFWTLSLNILK